MNDLRISLGPNLVSFNGNEIKCSITENKLIKAIGEPDREVSLRNDYLLYNGTYIYDRYGMTISFNHGEGSHMTLYYSLTPSLHYRLETIPYNIFHGTLVINELELPRTDKEKNRVFNEYNTKIKQTIAALNNIKSILDRESYYFNINGTRVHFQFDSQTNKKIQVISLSFESNRKRRKNNR